MFVSTYSIVKLKGNTVQRNISNLLYSMECVYIKVTLNTHFTEKVVEETLACH